MNNQLVFLVDNKVCMMQSLSCHWQLTRLTSFLPSCGPFVAVVVQLITQHLLEALIEEDQRLSYYYYLS